jgi:GTP-binding protein EngB required for normal cell division
LADGNSESALQELKANIKNEGLDGALKHFIENLDDWRNEPVKLAVTGKSGVGKSAFINAICNLKPGDPGFATTSGYGNITKYPGNPKITLHELPDFGTTEFPTNEYEEKMELHTYDSKLQNHWLL